MMHGQQNIKSTNCSEPAWTNHDWAMGWMPCNCGSILAEAKHFPLLRSLQMGSGVHPASISVDTSGFFHADKATDYLPPSSTKM